MFKILILLLLSVCPTFAGDKIHVLVSIAPQKFLVETIGKEHVSITVIVPPAANSHTYEPSPKQVVAAQKGEIWFRLGETFEPRLLASLRHTQVVDQREGIDLIQAGCGCCNTRDAQDPHIWLSPRLLKQLSMQISDVLCRQAPQHAEYFISNCQKLHGELDHLDQECSSALRGVQGKPILVSHPAFGYFCRDYGLQQLSIEMEGREPTPRQLTDLLKLAKEKGIKKVFLQRQHNPKGGMRIAEVLGVETTYVDPYLENVIENLRSIAHLFALA